MRIGCVSDTHVSGQGELPAKLLEGLAGVDLILHAGDLVSMDVLDELRLIAPVEAVAGNMDGWDVAKELPEKKIIRAGGFNIGLVHGSGRVPGMEDRVLGMFRPGSIDCLVYGHSHAPNIEKRAGVLLVNPGSPTDKRWAPFNSFAVITTDGEISAEIVQI